MSNQPLDAIELPATRGETFNFSGLIGKPILIYFYPKDNTPGCSTQAEQFRDLYPEFQALGWAIYGISRDSLQSHERFKADLNLPFELVSDPDEKVCARFNVIRMKNLYGKQVRGVDRSTFLFDAQGMLRKTWRGVKVPGHVQEVLAFIKTLEL